jgi:hypothetical protein
MKKLMLFIVVISITISSCSREESLKDYCGKKVVSRDASNPAGHHILYFKEEGNPNLISAYVTKAEYDYYQPGKVIDCEVKIPTNLPPGKID